MAIYNFTIRTEDETGEIYGVLNQILNPEHIQSVEVHPKPSWKR